MRLTLLAVMGACVLAVAGADLADARPAIGSGPQLGGITKRAQQFKELQVTEEDEIKLGASVSEKVRARYGVVQDKAVHRYVTLVGMLLVQKSTRPNLPFTFVVLDTDGVNAFAAPGGFIHITRGALGLLSSEAELAGVLAHEIEHVTEKHTIKAIQKGKMIQMGADETLSNPAVFSKLVDKTTELVMAGFGRNEELEADHLGVALSNTVGYAPAGLSDFLKRLSDRNKSATEKQGLFASHPEMQERLDKLATDITSQKLAAAATLAPRYKAAITYTAKPTTEITTVAAGTSGLAGGSAKAPEKTDEAKKEEPKKKGFGLGGLTSPGGSEKKQAEVTGSGASRGVDTERNAKGGSNPTLVVVQITPADLDAFRKQGSLK
ncbi:MAG: M48 family metalloprotease [Acidobacteria bacterium]|nr:M48 family metalloprotease [Acidobacteriota bacterium]